MTPQKTEMPCRNILVIEDDEDIRGAIVEALTDEGYNVYQAENGQVGMNLLPTIQGPTLVLLDMMMPVMNGWQFIEAQRTKAQFTDLSVVLVSAMPTEKALLGKDDLLPVEGLLRKPIDIDKLLAVVSQYCVPREVAMAESRI
jgi:CheY-like chemotaxis protein